MTTITCKACGHKLAAEDKRCPECGGGDRAILVADEGRGMEMIGLKKFTQGEPDYWHYTKSGEKMSRGRNRPAREHLVIDRKNGHKYHHVEEQDQSGQWSTVHHEDRPLNSRVEQARKREERQIGDDSS